MTNKKTLLSKQTTGTAESLFIRSANGADISSPKFVNDLDEAQATARMNAASKEDEKFHEAVRWRNLRKYIREQILTPKS